MSVLSRAAPYFLCGKVVSCIHQITVLLISKEVLEVLCSHPIHEKPSLLLTTVLNVIQYLSMQKPNPSAQVLLV